jgi:hypothetical protein
MLRAATNHNAVVAPESASVIVLIGPGVFADCEIRPRAGDYTRGQHETSQGEEGTDVYRKVVSASPHYRWHARCRTIFPDA